MAQLRDLIVNGASRFLGVVMFNNETHFNNNILLSNESTLNLLKTEKARSDEYTSPALVIGPSSGAHLEFDNIGVMAKSDASTASTLYLNKTNGIVSIGPGGLSVEGVVIINDDTSGSATTGALQINGGIKAGATYLSGVLTMANNIIPTTSEKNLGSTNARWNLYATSINNSGTSTLTGNVTASAKLTIGEGLTVNTGGASITGDTDIEGATNITGTLEVSNTTFLNELQLNGPTLLSNHLYLTGAVASSSTSNTSQIVFGTPTNNHVAISSNTDALVINKNTTTASPQIVLYINSQSKFPNGISCGPLTVNGNTAVTGTISVTSNISSGGTGTFSGNITVGTESATNPYYKLTDSNKNAWYFQALNNKCYIGPTSEKALNIDTSGNIQAVGSISIGRKANTTMGNVSVAIGYNVIASGHYSHAEGYDTIASGTYSHAEGNCVKASGESSHVEGENTMAYGTAPHAEGLKTAAYGTASHVEGGGIVGTGTITGDANVTTYTLASANSNIKAGQVIWYKDMCAKITAYDSSVPSITVNNTLSTTALSSVTATFYRSAASGNYSHAEGYNVIASGNSSHAEGYYTIASGNYSHAEGRLATASGTYSHAEGYGTTASGNYSHAEGRNITASGDYSHAEGYYTTANSKSQHVQGEYNVLDTANTTARSTYAHIVGNGTGSSARSNAHTLDWSGNAWFAGDVYVGSTSGTNKDGGSIALMKSANPTGTGYLSLNAAATPGSYSIAAGYSTTASGIAATALGSTTTASADYALATGYGTLASGGAATATGRSTTAKAANSFASGLGTIAAAPNQAVFGQYNKEDTDALFIVGNGSGGETSQRVNIMWLTSQGYLHATKVYGAVWNDYAEYRQTHNKVRAGQCVYEKGDGSLAISYERMMPGANIVSDTFGFAIGETKKCKTPLAVSGRVLAYPYEPKEEYKAGDAVCSGPNGTISKMTRAEIRDYPERIVGTVSEIPTYEVWGSGNVKVNGRIWIKVR